MRKTMASIYQCVVVLTVSYFGCAFAIYGFICPSMCICNRREKTVKCDVDYFYDTLPNKNIPQEVRAIEMHNQSIEEFDDTWTNMNLTHIRIIRLVNCGIANVYDNALVTFTKLKLLDLCYNNLRDIHPSIRNTSSLRELRLCNNDISLLHGNIFHNLTDLRRLDLSWNNISNLPDGVFYPLTNLKNLDLSRNTIFYISHDTFDGQTKLNELDISFNQVLWIDAGWLNQMTKLWVLRGRRFLYCNSTCTQNLLKLSSDIEFENFETLDLRENGLQMLPCGLHTAMPRLRLIFLAGNNFNEVPSNCFSNFSDLSVLSLAINSIHTLGKCAFCNISQLRELDLSYNKIANVNMDLFEGSRVLQILNMGDNRLSGTLDTNFLQLHVLSKLYLDGNRIRNISSDAFASLTNLELMNLGRNKISEISLEFDNLPNLKYLSLSANRLRSIHEAAFNGCVTLQGLYVDYNLLTTLHEKLFRRLNTLRQLSVHGNPFNCDCNIRWLHEALTKQTKEIVRKFQWVRAINSDGTLMDNINCSTPRIFQNKRIIEIQRPFDMICNSITPPLAIKCIVGISLGIVGLSTALYVMQLYCKAKKLEQHGGETEKSKP